MNRLHLHPIVASRSLLPLILVATIFISTSATTAPVAKAQELVGELTIDPNLPAGTDGNGRVLLFAPEMLDPGSSISHFDNTVSPDLLMEPSISSSLRPGDIDLTAQAMQDLGWPTGGGAQIVLRVADGPGEGFNDPSLGSQRLAAMQRAADIWAGFLASPVTINVQVQFSELACSETDGAVLAQAGPNFVFMFDGAPFPGTWYHGALAEALTGQNLSLEDNSDPNAGELLVTFNDQIDQACLGAGSSYSYALDSTPPSGQISFVSVALHEMGHGLGFANLINESSGQFFNGAPDIFSQFIRDNEIGRNWARMSAAQIRESATRDGSVAWDGNQVNRRARNLLDPSPVVRIESPSPAAMSFLASTAAFGPSIQSTSAAGRFSIVNDGSATPTLGCQPVVNRNQVRGSIAIVDRGECLFVDKVRNAQDAGAVGVVVVNNVLGLITLGGEATDITIPTLMIRTGDGDTLKQLVLDPPDEPDDEDDDDDDDDDDGGTGNEEPLEEVLEPEEPSTCTPDALTLCLQDGRFRVTVSFETAEGDTGTGMASPLTDETGTFWFFSEENIEVVVKLLDGCSITNAFWVFAAGLTDVRVEMRVVDTVTGAGKLYRNLVGTPFRPVQDTSALATCEASPNVVSSVDLGI